MYESLLEDLEAMFPGKGLLTPQNLCQFLECDESVFYNWTKRPDPARRPPRVIVGKDLRVPKREFVRWLIREQGSSGNEQQA